ncbi:MAG: hypothetical protein FJX29_07215, partial [Alphaproteobacteria bacterium]|nr:hypothetical protein [Alphaproteobacteria bacterium]
DPAAFAASLDAALSGGEIDCLLIRLREPAFPSPAIKALVSSAQSAGTAVLFENASLARACGGDGVHEALVSPPEQSPLASGPASETTPPVAPLRRIAPDAVAGAGNLRTRHDAMNAGEAGADYVMFGEPDANVHRPPHGAVCDRLAWWSEIFTVPSVAYAASFEEAANLAHAGADFAAMDDAIWLHPSGPQAGVREALQAIAAQTLATHALATQAPGGNAASPASGRPAATEQTEERSAKP